MRGGSLGARRRRRAYLRLRWLPPLPGWLTKLARALRALAQVPQVALIPYLEGPLFEEVPVDDIVSALCRPRWQLSLDELDPSPVPNPNPNPENKVL